MPTTLEVFGSTMDLSASRVLNIPALIFLCGGPIETKPNRDSSLRALLLDRISQDHPELLKKVLLAEKANSWSKAARHYENLFELEGDLAYLSSIILLLVESPGSFAELGAFCNIDPLRAKLVAVLEHAHENDESFIQDGPVALMKKHNPQSVLLYPWLKPQDEYGRRALDELEAQTTVEELVRLVVRNQANLKKEEKFDNANPGHIILLVADFVKLGSAVKLGEIENFLRGARLESEISNLDRHLFLLERLELIDKTHYGHKTYYVGKENPKEFVRYSVSGKQKTADRMRLRSDLAQILKPLDADRVRAREVYAKKAGISHG